MGLKHREKRKKREVFATAIAPEETTPYNIPFLHRDFFGFKEALAFKESQGKYRAVNTLGYLGKYQFGKTTLERFKIYDTTPFFRES